MKKQALRIALRIAAVFAVFMLLFSAQRAIFLTLYESLINASFTDALKAMATGLTMDASVAGYLTAIPVLISIATVWFGPSSALRISFRIYYAIAAALLAVVFTADLILYSYWGFRLDMTPVFYFTTSPSAAIASAQWWQLVICVPIVVGIGYGIYVLLRLVTRLTRIHSHGSRRGRVAATVVSVFMLGILFIAIRGGLTVSTMNPSRAYFSDNPRLNHAALNPMFSLMYSAGHRDDFDRQFRYFTQDEAEALFAKLNRPASAADSIPEVRLTVERPDIYLIILESFSSHLLPCLGGESIAEHLDSIARDGILWTDFYACSFRTDRAIPAIINAFPSQPTTSLMKYVDKIENLPSIARELKNQGNYRSTYFYGGDANFTNMQACLVSGGFDRIVSDKDFDISDRLSKWGAHDDILFDRVISETASPENSPRLSVIQTSSSHEPFEVPTVNPRFADNKRANSLAFTDSCLNEFVKRIVSDSQRRESLIVIVPDHYGTWPTPGTLDNPLDRHRIPLIMTGNALATRRLKLSTTGSQIDIIATIMGLLNMDSSIFIFSKNLLDPAAAHYAWFTEPELAAIVSDSGTTAILNTSADRAEKLSGAGADRLLDETKAYLQTVYTTIANLK